MLVTKRHFVLCILGCAALTVILISASLSTLEFDPGHPVVFQDEASVQDEKTARNPLLTIVLEAVFIFTGIMLLFVFILTSRPKIMKQQKFFLWAVGLAVLITAGAIPQLIYRLRNFLEKIRLARTGNEPGLPSEIYLSDPPGWLVLAVSLCLSVLILRIASLALQPSGAPPYPVCLCDPGGAKNP